MKTQNGKISNINKKLLMCGATFVIIATASVGVGHLISDSNQDAIKIAGKYGEEFSYEVSSDNKYLVTGTISHSMLVSNYELVETYNNINKKSELYIADLIKRNALTYGKCLNIMNNAEIWNDGDMKNIDLVSSKPLGEYLVTYDEIQPRYTIEDVKRILEKIKNDYEYKSEKELIKK